MKRIIVTLCAGLLAHTGMAQTFDDLDLSGIPNEFINGTNADADQVNANFQYLQNNLATLVSILEQQGTIAPPADRFAGTYAVNGIEVTMEAGACGIHTNGLVRTTHLSGTATSDGTTLSLSLSDEIGDLFIGLPSTLSTSTTPSSDSLAVTASGAITGLGQFTADGNSFYASARDVVSGSCDEVNIAYISGVRIP